MITCIYTKGLRRKTEGDHFKKKAVPDAFAVSINQTHDRQNLYKIST
jgi:hypothetical protein